MAAADAVMRISTDLPCLAAPRPNGSPALDRTIDEVEAWLRTQGMAVRGHPFVLRPYSMELMGLWLALSGLALPIAVLVWPGWLGLPMAILIVIVPLLEIRFLKPVVTAVVQRPARNLSVSFAPEGATLEVILCAHLDSKTELLDHAQRKVLLRLGLPAMVLAQVAGVLGTVGCLARGQPLAEILNPFAFLAALPVAVYGLAMGANLATGHLLRQQSTGAVDNGAAVNVTLALADRLQRGAVALDRVAVTLLFTVGEEAQMQGALAYVHDRSDWPLPAVAVNLEVLGQDGGYVLWETDGTTLGRLPASQELNDLLAQSVEVVTGTQPALEVSLSSDATAFLRRGIPAATLGSVDRTMGGRGYHSALDHPGRVHPERIREARLVVEHLLALLNTMSPHSFHRPSSAAHEWDPRPSGGHAVG